MLPAADVLAILDQLDRAGVVAWLDGGWGVDALLGEQTRPHQDLDLAIARDDLPAVQAALAGLGFRPDPTAAPGLPARMVLATADGGQVDLHPLVFDGHGNGWQELDGGAWAAYPADGLSGVGAVGGRRVRCLTPELQVRNHLGYPLAATDRHDLARLGERFGVPVPPGIWPRRPQRCRDAGSPDSRVIGAASPRTSTASPPGVLMDVQSPHSMEEAVPSASSRSWRRSSTAPGPLPGGGRSG